ncbi:hypothetical protein TWF970_011432 [Orbilia oligospora]|uniref:F-box domain-containing protein n=1 Tax=Orbilia oligospora TaxID=2813651 RepID=A0A7C8RCD4_ORBOL|nr:hypothetical protein TWF970_011432 [Orbilia oligospora]
MSQSCGFMDLPTELFLEILKNLNSLEKTQLSACSKSFYSTIFPFRNIDTIKIDVDNEYIPTTLKIFKENEFFAQFLGFYTRITFDLPTVEDLSLLIPLLSNFSSVTTIILRIRKCFGLEKTVYVKALSSLSALPYYNKIQNLNFSWKDVLSDLYPQGYYSKHQDDVEHMTTRTKMLRGYQGGDGYIERGIIHGDFGIIEEAGLGHTQQEIRQRDGFRRNTEQERGSGYSALGRYWVPNSTLTKLSLKKKLLLPKGLLYLKLMVPNYEYSFWFLLLHCSKIMVLEVPSPETSGTSSNDILGPTNDFPRIYKNPVLYQPIHPTIKALTLSSPRNEDEYLEFLPQLQIYFPNLISLITLGQRSGGYLENVMAEKLTQGYYKELRIIRSAFGFKFVRGFIITRIGEGSGGQAWNGEYEWVNDKERNLDNHSKEFSYLNGHGTAWWDPEDLEELKKNTMASEDFGAGGDEFISTEYEEGSEYDSERERVVIEAAVKLKKQEEKELREENF